MAVPWSVWDSFACVQSFSLPQPSAEEPCVFTVGSADRDLLSNDASQIIVIWLQKLVNLQEAEAVRSLARRLA